MPDLKPCPFCGSERVRFIEHDEQNYEYRTEGFIFCERCGFSSDTYFVEDAIQKWNRRAGEEDKHEQTD